MAMAWRIVKPYRVIESKALAPLEILVYIDMEELMDDYFGIPTLKS